jgi:hypothetical protein
VKRRWHGFAAPGREFAGRRASLPSVEKAYRKAPRPASGEQLAYHRVLCERASEPYVEPRHSQHADQEIRRLLRGDPPRPVTRRRPDVPQGYRPPSAKLAPRKRLIAENDDLHTRQAQARERRERRAAWRERGGRLRS